mmetsp:Transcript_16949/g.37688  ORF Transcript_16949/g.37688 Transcript_16949/m.37688 type:complete len:257 (+) Transcript_16949:118-888(+)
MISDLSPGDKLSLKGKIFELQKKLQIIEFRNKQNEEFPYKPKTTRYDLPDRDRNVLVRINKAELMRQQKKKMLEAAMLLQSGEGCTFTPEVTARSRALLKGKVPVPAYMRLTEQGKQYDQLKEQRRQQHGMYDDSGRRLFTPAINRSVEAPPPLTGDAGADEYLYQDARDREERYRMRSRESQREAALVASASKMNASSVALIRRRAVGSCQTFATFAPLTSPSLYRHTHAPTVGARGSESIQLHRRRGEQVHGPR